MHSSGIKFPQIVFTDIRTGQKSVYHLLVGGRHNEDIEYLASVYTNLMITFNHIHVQMNCDLQLNWRAKILVLLMGNLKDRQNIKRLHCSLGTWMKW